MTDELLQSARTYGFRIFYGLFGYQKVFNNEPDADERQAGTDPLDPLAVPERVIRIRTNSCAPFVIPSLRSGQALNGAGCHAYACVSMSCPSYPACPRERGHGTRHVT
jgi:hypothetical protein